MTSKSHELSSVSRDIVLYMQGAEFELRSSHLSTLRVEFRVTRLLDKKKKPLIIGDTFLRF
jgi:hypothetical protein